MCFYVFVKEVRFFKGLFVFVSKSKIYGRVEDNFWFFVYWFLVFEIDVYCN